ncbi:DegT/DnrJ/EryC1/StrS family aminotransferase [Actinomadura keratinilytica]
MAERRRAADHLDQRLRGVGTPERDRDHTYTQYVVRVPGNGWPDRDAFARALRARGVACSVPVQTPLHRTTEHWRDVRLPETERAADDTLALPLVPVAERRGLHRLVSACNALGGLLQPPEFRPLGGGARGARIQVCFFSLPTRNTAKSSSRPQ